MRCRLGIDLDSVREVAESTFGPGALQHRQERRRRGLRTRARRGPGPVIGHIPFSPRAKKALELALREALRLGHNYIGPEHLALGLLREGRGTACTVISRRDVTLPVVLLALEAALRRAA
ncbi:MAG: Clp protease N-terminal domain-containing protein [Acidimicrobiia bacterium]